MRLEGINHQWRKIPPGELSIDPDADERFGWVTGWVGALQFNCGRNSYVNGVASHILNVLLIVTYRPEFEPP